MDQGACLWPLVIPEPQMQDTTVAVKTHRDVMGFGPWVNKAHFYHAQAPAEMMARMISVRLHLDDSGSEKACGTAPRRVLHIEWANFELPGGLEWAWF